MMVRFLVCVSIILGILGVMIRFLMCVSIFLSIHQFLKYTVAMLFSIEFY